MTIEAAIIIPLVVGLYIFLIFAAFLQYNKCALTQDAYLKCLRASLFTYWEDGYGEVSYGMLLERSMGVAREYIESRSDYGRYPFFELGNEKITALQQGVLTPEVFVMLKIDGTAPSFFTQDYQVAITTLSSISNPVGNIRKARRAEKNAGD